MILRYTCPNCGADMSYSIELGKLYCMHCDHSESIGEDDASLIELEPEPASQQRVCANCGGVLTSDEKTCSTHCQYCDASLVFADRLTKQYRPAFVLPFKLDRKKAEDAFKKWCHNGRFSPKGFMSAKNIKNLQAMYVPFYLYDLDTTVDVRASATKVHVYRRGDTEYTETSFYDVYRKLKLDYKHVPYDASEKMDDTLMAKLQPYDYTALKVFEMPYLAGFDTDQADYEPKELLPLVKQQVNEYAVNYARGTIQGYTAVTMNHKDVVYDQVRDDYVYLPIWFISYRYRDQDYIFAMNGQTGKVIGTPPLSKGKVAGWFAGISTAIFAVLLVIGGLL